METGERKEGVSQIAGQGASIIYSVVHKLDGTVLTIIVSLVSVLLLLGGTIGFFISRQTAIESLVRDNIRVTELKKNDIVNMRRQIDLNEELERVLLMKENSSCQMIQAAR